MRALLGIVVLALAFVAGPARADTPPGSVTGIDSVLHDDCLNYPYSYTLQIPADASQWTLDVTAYGPDGQQVKTDSRSNEAASGTGSFFLCTRPDGFGTYTIRSTFHWWTGDPAVQHDALLADSSFTLRKPASRTTVAASTRRPQRGQVVRYRIATRDEHPAGFVANEFAWVHLEKKAHGHWVRIKGGRGMTHSTGRVTVRVRYPYQHKRLRIRAVTEPAARYAASTSRTIRIW